MQSEKATAAISVHWRSFMVQKPVFFKFKRSLKKGERNGKENVHTRVFLEYRV